MIIVSQMPHRTNGGPGENRREFARSFRFFIAPALTGPMIQAVRETENLSFSPALTRAAARKWGEKKKPRL
jgi:hypothetical protein